ncbi:unnamed protein product [Dicrocoelium dendriticum]|nr:unnamed protein product [Dicrocoelium dendriticum]
MTEVQNVLRQCFHCDAKFDKDGDFLDHIYSFDCKSVCDKLAPQNSPKGSTGSSIALNSREEAVHEPHIALKMEDQACSSDKGLACALCDLQFRSNYELYEHSRSPSHRQKVSSAANRYNAVTNTKRGPPSKSTPAFTPMSRLYCEQCQVPLPCAAAMEAHLVGKKHQKTVAKLNEKSNLTDLNNGSIVMPPTPAAPAVQQPSLTQSSVARPESEPQNPTRSHTTGKCSESVDVSSIQSNGQLINSEAPNSSHASLSSSDTDLCELNSLLRRLCYLELLALIHRLNGSPSLPADINFSNDESIPTGINSVGLLDLFRAICREELYRILPSDLLRCSTSGASLLEHTR